MCKSMEERVIQASINALKSVNVSDETIIAYLLENFDFLSEEEAKDLIKEYEA